MHLPACRTVVRLIRLIINLSFSAECSGADMRHIATPHCPYRAHAVPWKRWRKNNQLSTPNNAHKTAAGIATCLQDVAQTKEEEKTSGTTKATNRHPFTMIGMANAQPAQQSARKTNINLPSLAINNWHVVFCSSPVAIERPEQEVSEMGEIIEPVQQSFA